MRSMVYKSISVVLMTAVGMMIMAAHHEKESDDLASLKEAHNLNWDSWNSADVETHFSTVHPQGSFIGDDGEVKAVGGYFGDTRLNFKYLHENTGKGIGPRIFFAAGLVIPSNNTLTESPWALSDHDNNPITEDRYTPHRHFYLSDGAYKMFFEGQFFKKRAKIRSKVNPCFNFLTNQR